MALQIKRSLVLDKDMYYQKEYAKNLIVLHHTVGGSASSTFNWWSSQPKHIATAYIVDRDGTVYEIFDPKHWAYHLGLRNTAGAHDKRSIGIELASWGGLVESGGKLYRNDTVSPKSKFTGEHFDCFQPWRGYRYFEQYTPQQHDSVINLVKQLLDSFDIPRKKPADHTSFNPGLYKFKGLLGHHHVRVGKSDVHPGFDWNKMIDFCSLEEV